MKTYFLLTICIFFSYIGIVASQNYGVANGLNYQNDWNSDINNVRQKYQLTQQAKQAQINKIQSSYKQLVDLYNSQSEYKSISSDWHTVTATNGYDFMENRKVYVMNNQVTGYINGEGKTLRITKGGNIINEKTTICTETNLIFELYFGFVQN